MKRSALAALALLFISCASAPRPRVMGEVDSTRLAPASRVASRLAPQAYARAEQLRQRAEGTLTEGDRAGAQIVSEHALAAYDHAFVLARLVTAEHEFALGKQKLASTETELALIDEQQRRLSAEADDLELRVKVARDALPLVPSAASSPEREQARRDAARALASQARLLCVATRLLDPKRANVTEDIAKLDALDKSLTGKPGATPIDEAMRLRANCLRSLTEVRRSASSAMHEAGVADALLAELSKVGDLFPFRDDRGVVVTLRGLFAGADKLLPAAEERLALLGRVAKAHPGFPVLVVVHTPQGSANAMDQKRAEVVAAALRKAGAPEVEARPAGSSQPVSDPSRTGAAQRNDRVEIVFVSPA